MIKRIEFSNFYSYKGNQVICFTASKKSGYDYFRSKTGDRITKIAGIAGANGSGKTNLMRIFGFLKYFAVVSSSDNKKNQLQIGFKTFFKSKKTSKFYIEFEDKQNVYFYKFSIKNYAVESEELSRRAMKPYAKTTTIYKRNSSGVEYLHGEYFKNFPRGFLKNCKSDISYIAFLKANYDISVINDIFSYFDAIQLNINERGDVHSQRQKQVTVFTYWRDKELLAEAVTVMKKFDLGLTNVTMSAEEEGEDTYLRLEGAHKVGSVNKKLDFDYESRGTRSLFFSLAYLLGALRQGTVVILDELETGLHPEALNKIIDYFIDQSEDISSQLIFSSHALGFMNRLDMHQIYLVEKNSNCESEVFRLNEVKGVRTDENFYSKYSAGAYGGFPKIRI